MLYYFGKMTQQKIKQVIGKGLNKNLIEDVEALKKSLVKKRVISDAEIQNEKKK